MNSLLRHPLRVTGRLAWLTAELLLAALTGLNRILLCPRTHWPQARAIWLKESSTRLLRVFRLTTQTDGRLPSSGMLVCNHLGYLDVLVLASLTPCRFVAKSEVRGWPLLGGLARLAGTVFVQRGRRTGARQSSCDIAAAIQTGILVVLFPEGTSSGGHSLLPFKSSLLKPATDRTHALTAGRLAYHVADGDVSEEVCYWKDMTLVPHLVNLLGKESLRATVCFGQLPDRNRDRKQLARQLHALVLNLNPAPRLAMEPCRDEMDGR